MQTEVHLIKSARKRHMCSWCAEPIDVGNPYARYRWYSGSDVSTVKEHPECYEAMLEVIKKEGMIEFMPGDYPRGRAGNE